MFRISHSLRSVALTAALITTACGGSGGTSNTAKVAAKTVPVEPPASMVGTKLAKVNNIPVGSNAFEILSQRKTPADGKAFSLEEKREVVDLAVTDEVLFQEAFRQGLYHDPKVRKIMVNLLLRQDVYGTVRNDDFDDAQLKAYFDEHKEEFVVPAKVHIKRLFVAISDKRAAPEAQQIAQGLYEKVKANPDTFRDVAAESSDGPFKRRGGDLGYVSKEGKPGIPAEVTARAFELEANGMTEPFLAAGGFNVLYVPNRRERLERTFEQMRGSVLRRMKNERYDSLSSEYVDKLRADAQIEILEDALGNYTPIPNSRASMPIQQAPPAPLKAIGEQGVPKAAPDADGAPELAPSGEPPTGDPIRDMGDAVYEARKLMEEDEGDE
jgi:hypothetical protein